MACWNMATVEEAFGEEEFGGDGEGRAGDDEGDLLTIDRSVGCARAAAVECAISADPKNAFNC